MLLQQEKAAPPVQSNMQGLASMFRQGLAGYLQYQDSQDQQAAQSALMKGMSAKPWVNPDTGKTSTAPAGGLEGALTALGGVDNGYGRNLAQQLQIMKLGQDRQDQAGATKRAQELADQKTAFANKKALLPRKYVKAIDGKMYDAATGKRVVPGAQTRQEQFIKSISPPSSNLGGGAGSDLLNSSISGASGADILSGGEPTQKPNPTVREIFNALPIEAQNGIKMSSDPMKAMSTYLLRKKGLDIQFNSDGTVSSISQGGVAGNKWSKKSTSTLENKLINAREGLARLGSIDQSFRPEFQQWGARLSASWSALKERSGITLSAKDKAQLADYSAYKIKAIGNINNYIREITGAQMSEAEAVRLRKGVPDPGDSWYNGDSPTQFESKMKSQIRQLKEANARYVYALKNGWDTSPKNLAKVLPLDKVGDLIDERGTALERQLRARRPDLPQGEVEKIVSQQLSAEFGLNGR